MKFVECDEKDNPLILLFSGKLCNDGNWVIRECEGCKKDTTFKYFAEEDSDGRCLCKECREKINNELKETKE